MGLSGIAVGLPLGGALSARVCALLKSRFAGFSGLFGEAAAGRGAAPERARGISPAPVSVGALTGVDDSAFGTPPLFVLAVCFISREALRPDRRASFSVCFASFTADFASFAVSLALSA
jgi:hypothetical protein